MNCTNPFHLGGRAEPHSTSRECLPHRLESNEWVCDNRCHTHPERSPKVFDLHMEGCIRLFDAIVNNVHAEHLPKVSNQERKEIALYYLGIEPAHLETMLEARRQ